MLGWQGWGEKKPERGRPGDSSRMGNYVVVIFSATGAWREKE